MQLSYASIFNACNKDAYAFIWTILWHSETLMITQAVAIASNSSMQQQGYRIYG